jgi:xanthine dehydrogenase YagR molybdenum-binding subunit
VRLETGTQDIGTGTFTIMNQLAAEILGLSPDQITLGAGDSQYPEAVGSGGSRTTVTTGSAVAQAAREVLKKAKKMAYSDKKSPLYGVSEAEIVAENGRLQRKNNPKIGETFAALLKRNGNKPIEETVKSEAGNEKENYSMYAFGAIFAEVRVDEVLGEVRVTRLLATVAAGKIINLKTARSQILGGMIWGVSMALQEHGIMDPRSNRVMNANLAEYHVPVNADIREIDAFFIPEDDEIANPAGVKGIGEIGIVGAVSAIANAIFHATGKRHYEVPITVEMVLA